MQGARFEQVILRRPDLRRPLPPRFASRLRGQTVRRLSRRGKYLVAVLSSGDVLLMHLGMSGSFRIIDDRHVALPPLSHDHVVFQMSSGARVVYNDPRRFGSMDLVRERDLSSHAALRTLGPEPLAAGFDPAVLAAACRGKRTSLKAALSDQRVVAGLGNIYVCEALHRARLSPRRRASSIVTRAGAPREAAARLAAAIRLVLAQAIRPARRGAAPGEVEFRVYDREGQGCTRRDCPGVIRRIVQAGRSTFYCPVCQR